MLELLLGKVTGIFSLTGTGGGSSGFPAVAGGSNAGVALAVTALAGILAVTAAVLLNSRSRLKSPWSRRKSKHALSPQQWRSMFTSEGKLRDGGTKFLKKVRSGGVDPRIRAEVWPFLLGIYDLNTSKEDRNNIRTRKRKEYEKLRRRCRKFLKQNDETFDPFNLKDSGGTSSDGGPRSCFKGCNSPDSDDAVSARESLSSEDRSPFIEFSGQLTASLLDSSSDSKRVADSASMIYESDSFDSDSSEEPETSQSFPSTEIREENDIQFASSKETSSPFQSKVQSKFQSGEDFATWQRIIRLDAIRANGEWISYSPSQAEIQEDRARRCAETVGLKDYDNLEPSSIYHAARLVAILEAYALYDPEIGYCQGMSDLLSPIIAVMKEDHEAFWCFVGFMRKARHNFRLDEVGIKRQLNIVSKIIKFKDSHLYRHLEKLQAEDCFFVYRMVVVLFRRELTFEQTLCLWEVVWADQTAIRAGLWKSAWSRIRLRAPPTDDLLLYAIAASVLQRRKLIIEKYNSMDEILKECNGMAGHLDIWRLLDDAHGLVVTLHDKIEASM